MPTTVQVAVATLVFALAVAAYDDKVALIYAIVAAQVRTLDHWAILTVAFLPYFLYKAGYRQSHIAASL